MFFARIGRDERSRVVGAPGVIRIVGSRRESLPIPDWEIDFLKESLAQKSAAPYDGLVHGDRVKFKRGPLLGVEGTLVRENDVSRFILTIELINQHASITVDIADVELIEKSR